jgi:MFS family permease
MFFLLLLIRDLVGITEQTQLQETFSSASIIFFLAAAAAAVLSAPGGGVEKDASGGDADMEARLDRIRQHKVYMLLGSMTVFGLCCFAIPFLNLLDDVYSRQTGFYVIAIVFGASFGMAFSRFQDCTWGEVRSNAVRANAMGFNVMSRLFGVGLGNLIAGIMLDQFYTGEEFVGAVNPVELKKPTGPISTGLLQLIRPAEQHDISQVYRPMGYTLMCSSCGVLVLLSCVLAWDAMLRSSLKAQLAAERSAPRVQVEQ